MATAATVKNYARDKIITRNIAKTCANTKKARKPTKEKTTYPEEETRSGQDVCREIDDRDNIIRRLQKELEIAYKENEQLRRKIESISEQDCLTGKHASDNKLIVETMDEHVIGKRRRRSKNN